MLLSTEMPVPLVCAVSAAMAEVMAWGKRAGGPVNFPRSSQNRVSLIGGRCGCRVSETDVMVSARGVGGLRPVTPGVFIFRSCAKSRLWSSRVAVSCRWGSWGGSVGLKTTGVCVMRKVFGHVAFRESCCCAMGWFGEELQLSAMGSWMWRSLVASVCASLSVSVVWFGHVHRACSGVWASVLQSGHRSLGNAAGFVL